MRRWSAFVLFVVVACGSSDGGGRPAGVAKPEFRVGLTHDIFFGGNRTAPATVEVAVLNRAQQPITLRRVELSSPGMTQYAIYPVNRDFRETIPPGETKAVTIFAIAETTVRNQTEPLTLRAIIELEAAGKRWRELVISR